MSKLKMGLIGGGAGAFIGPVHRMAAELDGDIELVCGAFASEPARSHQAGVQLYGLAPVRSYGDTTEMFAAERALPAVRRMDFVVIATPNHTHFAIARAALQAGFHVVCDKPMTLDLEQARVLRDAVRASGLVFALTHNYSGYPLVKEARRMLLANEIGRVRRVQVEYLQGWLAGDAEAFGSKQARWRTDPARAGAAGCCGDIGSHAQHLAEYVTGLRIESLCADLNTFVPGRRLDDDGSVLLRFAGGARGTLTASQIAVGEENALHLRVYGETGSIEWQQQEPNTLIVKSADRATQLRRTGGSGLSPVAAAATRLPAGHPEGFLEGFANVYRAVAAAIRARRDGVAQAVDALDFPGVEDGVRGMAFIEAAVQSSRRGGQWVQLADD